MDSQTSSAQSERFKLAAVVVTFNRLHQLKTTINRLLSEDIDHLYVVDNGSTDQSRDWLASLTEPRLHILLAEKNLGGAGGFEVGLKAAVAEQDPDWIVVMDDDARPYPGAMTDFRALDLANRHAVAGAVYYPNGQICEMNRPSRNPFWHPRVFLKTLFGGGRLGFHIPDSDYQGGGLDLDASSFVGFFVSRAAITQVGYPDGRLFLYGDDVIYTLGLRKSGLTLRFAPGIRFEHDCTTFTGTERVYSPIWKVYYNYRNGLIMYRLAAGILCPSSYKMEHQSGLSFGGSGSFA